jgi:signal transduction histidine kinase/CheY-like chemotaxis protein/CHASE3 domain sensor protein
MAQFSVSEARNAGQFGPPLPPWPLAGFAAAIVAVLLNALLIFGTLQTREENVKRLTHTIEVSNHVQAVLSTLQDAETGQRGYLLTGETSYLAPYTNARASLEGTLRAAKENVTAERRLRQLEALDRLANAKMEELDQSVALQRDGKTNEALAAVRTDRGQLLMDQIRGAVAQIQAEERAELQRAEEDWVTSVDRSLWVFFGGKALLIVLILIAATSTSREYRARQTQSWLRTGQMGLTARLQGERRIEMLSQHVIDYLAAYLEAGVGAVYLAEGGRFRRVAGYAIAPDIGEVVGAGQTLIGQAAKDKRALHVRDVPANHIHVASGVGRSQPSQLLIMPASADGVVMGVIELGFFRQVNDADKQMLELIAEPIALALRAAIDQRRLEELLAETQRQAEELQTQQEELRVTNEELEQQSNALRDSQARLEAQQSELEQSNVQLEEHSQQLSRQNDELELARGELTAKAAELERSNQFKSEFLANMSHELRTPLNSSLILAKLLGDNPTGNLTEEQVKFANNIYSAGNDLLELINDILDLSKIEARKVDMNRETISVPQLVDNLAQTFRPMADQKGIAFEAAIEPGAPAVLSSDSQRIRQVLKNLLSNAIKFTAKGGVKLRVFLPVGSQGSEDIGFDVIDTGIGIAPEQHQIIFEPFRQADGTTNRRFGGTGLGLSISRELASLLGGRITLQSTPGVGSTFTLLLPRTLPERAEEEVVEPRVRTPAKRAPRAPRSVEQTRELMARNDAAQFSGARVLLIIEDDIAFANTLAELGRGLQYECMIALTADEGIELALRHRPTAIVLDVQLPDHTGLTVLDRLKHNPATRHIPIQVISGFDYTQAALEMGAANVMLKPVDRDRLVDALSKLGRKAAHEERAVLIVEDNTIQRDSIQQLLKSESVRAVAVASASDALAQLRATTFDCMVLDLALPDTTGFELLEKMASDDAYSFPPVIVYTARAISQIEEQQLRRYSKSIIIKGAKSPERLLDEVTLFLHKVEESLPAEQQRLLRIARSRESVFEGRRILLVEDDVRNVFAITRVLEPHGAKLEIARNGIEALAALKAHPELELVLMDIMMPEMDGLTAMQEIRKQPELAKLPIIALTAKAMPDDRQRCLDAGANDYITKPIDIEKLLSLLRIWLPARRGALA